MSVRRSVLANGIRVVTERVEDLRSATIGFWYEVGSRDEKPEEQGICHFIEHMMFKGTPTRSARQIAEQIDAVGGQLNAFTTKEHTCYYARVLDVHVPRAVELLADMLLNSSMDPADVEKEKSVVLEEIRLYEDTPDELVHELAAEAALGRHPAARSVLGTEESVRSFTSRRLKEFVRQHYTGGRLVVAAAGRVDHDALVAQVSEHFAGLAPDPARRRPHPARSEFRWLVRSKETEQVHLCVSTPGLAAGDPDRWAMLCLDSILGGGVSSRFFQKLREERGWVYATYSYHTALWDAGFFAVYAGTASERAASVLELVQEELIETARAGVGPEELNRAKEHLKGSLMLGLESTSQRMSRLARGELTGEGHLSPDEVLARIDGVGEEDVRRLAERLFDPDRFAYAAVGPVSWETQRRVADAV